MQASSKAQDLVSTVGQAINWLDRTFVKFIFVGGLAYLVNQAALYGLYDLHAVAFLPGKDTDLDLGPVTHPDILLLIASALAVEIAIVFKFYVHEHWTFRKRGRMGWAVARFAKFNGASILNPLIIVATVNILTPVFDVNAYLSNTIGTLAGFIVNWFFSHHLIWPHIERATRPRPATEEGR